MANNPQSTGMQPRLVAHVGPPPNSLLPMPIQFRPLAPPPPPPSFIPMGPQQFQPIGHSIQYPQAPPPLQPPPLQRHVLPQGTPNSFMPAFAGPGIPHISFSSGGQTQINVVSTAQHLPMSQTDAPPNFSAPWFSSGTHNTQSGLPMQPALGVFSQNINPVTPLQQNSEQNTTGKNTLPDLAKPASSDWREHTSRGGKKYYYNKKTRVSTWDKPFELMTPIERADASTDWREFTTPEGRRFYFNNATKTSKWAIPDEVQLARDRVNANPSEGTSTDIVNSYAVSSTPEVNNLSSSVQENVIVPSPVSVTPAVDPDLPEASGTSSTHEVANLKSDSTGLQSPLEITTTPMRISNASPHEAAVPSFVKISTENVDEDNRGAEVSGSGDSNLPEEQKLDDGPLVYETKEEAKNAFKALLEASNVGSDWSWDQAMRLIIKDRRYGALRTLGERKQTFNEFVGQKKKQESEERRARQKKAKEDFKTMLQECKDLTYTTRWSKAISMFEKDERFQAIDRVKDREDLFDDHLEELKQKERAKALEEKKLHKAEYLEFLKSCDFVRASSQWRRVQDRLEDDERCLRLEKIDRLEIFQEYIRDLEKEEEELRKLRMEEQRKAERKNRDEFRKLMEEHVANGALTANTHWRDYCMKVVKDAPAHLAVCSNTTGSTAKDLFQDVVDDLEKQYSEDRENIEAAMKAEKIFLSSSWTIEDFKGALSKELKSKSVSDINLKLVFDDLIKTEKEKEEKEAKKLKRLTEDVYKFLFVSKDISPSSKWEDFKPLVEKRFTAEESFFLEIFNKVINELKEKAKEKERRRKEQNAKDKERRDKEMRKDRRNRDRGPESRKGKERRKSDDTESDRSGSYGLEENRRSNDRRRKQQKRSFDTSSLDDDEKDRARSRRRSVESKRSKQMADVDFDEEEVVVV
ncbi:hypothetical protein ACP275_14G107200 [Erythranthe tilingii]